MNIIYILLFGLLFLWSCSQNQSEIQKKASKLPTKAKELVTKTKEQPNHQDSLTSELESEEKANLIDSLPAELSFDELVQKFKYKELDTLSFELKDFVRLYNKQGGEFYRLSYSDIQRLGLHKFFESKGYEAFDESNYSQLLFAYCFYQINENVIALCLLNLVEGAYRLDMLTYYQQALVAFSVEPICFSWADIGFIQMTQARRIAFNNFISETKNRFQSQLKEHYKINIKIDSLGNIKEEKVDLLSS